MPSLGMHVVRRIAFALVALAGCDTPAPRPEPPRNIVPPPAAGPGDVPIEKVPRLAMKAYPQAARDCHPSAVARRRFAGSVVRACGSLSIVTDEDWERGRDYRAVARRLRPALDCASAAIAAHHPFIVEQQVAGTDSAVARGLVGVLEGGKLVVYSVHYDSNPCGGGCPEDGHTTVMRCDDHAATPDTDCSEVDQCFHCAGRDDKSVVEDCVYGRKP
jgi:hypothetical protein